MILNTDGGARGNPGPGAAGAVLKNAAGEIISERGIYLGICTNNEAEYHALILGLKLALENKAQELTCYLDSELIVKQLNGEYSVKSEHLKELYTQVKDIAKSLTKIEFVHVPRSQNKDADKIVNEVLDASS